MAKPSSGYRALSGLLDRIEKLIAEWDAEPDIVTAEFTLTTIQREIDRQFMRPERNFTGDDA